MNFPDVRELPTFALTLAPQAKRAGRPAGGASKLVVLQKITAAIEANLSNPHLDATAVATTAGVSIRHANAVLASQGTSITGLIQSLRLTRCRIALKDPMQERRKISEIAYGWRTPRPAR
jgi:AraC family transcriptional regulator, positive regulator of tynA and feaB